MFYTLYSDKIVLEDDSHKTVAQLNFPETQPGIHEVSNVFVDASLNEKRTADRMMNKAIDHFRKTGARVIPACSFAEQWFSEHPENADMRFVPAEIVTDTEDTTAGALTTESWDEPADFVSKPELTQTEDMVPEINDSPEESVDFHSDFPEEEDDFLEEDTRNRRRNGSSYKMKAGQKQKKKRSHTSNTPSKVSSAIGSVLKFFSRIMQLISGLCMAGILFLFGSSFLGNATQFGNPLTNHSKDAAILLGGGLLFLLFCVLQFFWIMSKKKFAQLDRVIKIDTGRGITAFILIIILYFVCRMTGGLDSIFGFPDGALALSETFLTNDPMIFLVPAIGAILSILRKMIGR